MVTGTDGTVGEMVDVWGRGRVWAQMRRDGVDAKVCGRSRRNGKKKKRVAGYIFRCA